MISDVSSTQIPSHGLGRPEEQIFRHYPKSTERRIRTLDLAIPWLRDRRFIPLGHCSLNCFVLVFHNQANLWNIKYKDNLIRYHSIKEDRVIFLKIHIQEFFILLLWSDIMSGWVWFWSDIFSFGSDNVRCPTVISSAASPWAPRAGLNPQPSVFKSGDLTTRPCSPPLYFAKYLWFCEISKKSWCKINLMSIY